MIGVCDVIYQEYTHKHRRNGYMKDSDRDFVPIVCQPERSQISDVQLLLVFTCIDVTAA